MLLLLNTWFTKSQVLHMFVRMSSLESFIVPIRLNPKQCRLWQEVNGFVGQISPASVWHYKIEV